MYKNCNKQKAVNDRHLIEMYWQVQLKILADSVQTKNAILQKLRKFRRKPSGNQRFVIFSRHLSPFKLRGLKLQRLVKPQQFPVSHETFYWTSEITVLQHDLKDENGNIKTAHIDLRIYLKFKRPPHRNPVHLRPHHHPQLRLGIVGIPIPNLQRNPILFYFFLR